MELVKRLVSEVVVPRLPSIRAKLGAYRYSEPLALRKRYRRDQAVPKTKRSQQLVVHVRSNAMTLLIVETRARYGQRV